MTERDGAYTPHRWYGEIHFYEDGSYRQTNGSSFEKWLAAHDEAVRQEEQRRHEDCDYHEGLEEGIKIGRAGASRPAAPATREAVTEDMVERAAVVFYRSQTGHGGLATSFYAPAWRNVARQALEAALTEGRAE